jgi:hypothetical protein
MVILFIDKLLLFPLWVKQIIYLRLHQNLSLCLSEDFISTREDNLFHLYVPLLSFIGKTELVERKSGLDTNIYNFLTYVADGLNMLEISMNNFWTMEEVAKYFIFCLDQNYVKTPESDFVYAMAGFMAGKFRTGEYFKRSHKINVDQLERAILVQKESIKDNKPLKIAEIMINLGYITEKDTTSLLLIKDEAKKRFILDASIIPEQFATQICDEQSYKDEIAKLTEQNKVLKEQINRVLAFVKKNN